jgi:hypothetical protein
LIDTNWRSMGESKDSIYLGVVEIVLRIGRILAVT